MDAPFPRLNLKPVGYCSQRVRQAWGLGLGPEDEVVTTDAEHFGMLGPLASSGVSLRMAGVLERPAEEALQAVLEAVTPRTTERREGSTTTLM